MCPLRACPGLLVSLRSGLLVSLCVVSALRSRLLVFSLGVVLFAGFVVSALEHLEYVLDRLPYFHGHIVVYYYAELVFAAFYYVEVYL